MQYGYLYIISNESFPGYIKFGSTKDLNKRLSQYQTASPFRNYVIEYSVYHPNYIEAERKFKDNLKYFATRIKNEWYEMDKNMAKSILIESLEEYQEKS